MLRAVLALQLAFAAVVLVSCGGGSQQPPRGGTEPGARPAASAEEQDRRKEVIAKLVAEGFFREVEYTGTPVVWVTPKFLALDFKDKELFAGVVAAYAYRVPKGDKLAPGEDVHLVDVKTGKPVGHLSADGLFLD